MIQKQKELSFSPYSKLYDIVIPKEHRLRKFNELIDFSFVSKELNDKYCHNNGRNAVDPVRMFKYLLLKVLDNLSDVDVVEHSRYDMSYKYFLGMAPEESVINSSSLTKFRKLRLKDSNLLDMLIGKTVEIAIERGLIKKDATIIVDATHTRSRYNQKSQIEVLRELSKQLRKSVYVIDESIKESFPQKPTNSELDEEITYCKSLIDIVQKHKVLPAITNVQEKVNLLQEVLDDNLEQIKIQNDPDARVGHKTADTSFFGYKTHLAMTDERIITAAVITSGEKSDGKQLQELIEKTKATGLEVENVVGDTAYSGKENIEMAEQESFKLVSKLNPVITNGKRKKEDEFQFNKDAGMFVCPAGHMAIKKVTHKKETKQENQIIKYHFDVEKCKYCPISKGCYKSGAKSKSYSVSIKSSAHTKQAKFQESDYFKEKSKERYKIEAKNSELKNRHGYNIAASGGINNMQLQSVMTIFVVNLKRITKLQDK